MIKEQMMKVLSGLAIVAGPALAALGLAVVGLAVVGLAVVGLARPAMAASGPVGPRPLGSPGDWVLPEDYPALALRLDIGGTVAFRLIVDATGKTRECQIVKSSGFDLLDSATCEQLVAKAQFAPALDSKGKPTTGAYSNRVRWMVPKEDEPAIGEKLIISHIRLDATGKLINCQTEWREPASLPSAPIQDCKEAPDPALIEKLRAGQKASPIDVELVWAFAFTPELRASLVAPREGFVQRGLSVHTFTVGSQGQMVDCAYEEQRGEAALADNYCREAWAHVYDPPFGAVDKDGKAKGWYIHRVLQKAAP